MSSTFYFQKPVLPSFVAREQDEYTMLIYLSIPELRVERSSEKYPKHTVSNGRHEFIEFKDQSIQFAINVENKFYSLSIERLPDFIQPNDCFVTYEDRGCWITLKKLNSISWMSQICHDQYPGLDRSKRPN